MESRGLCWKWFSLSVMLLLCSCKDDDCTRIECVGNEVILFSILDSMEGTDLVYDQNLIDPETDLRVFYEFSNQLVDVSARRHFGKIRFHLDFSSGANRYYLDVLGQIDTLDTHFVLEESQNDPHHCCSESTYRIDSLYLNGTLFLPELPGYANSQLEIFR